MNNKRVVALALLVTILTTLSVLFLYLNTNRYPSSTGNDQIDFRLKWVIYSSFAHHFVAKETGLYEEESLNVSIRPGGAGIDPIKLVASGEDDIGLASYAQILLAREQGIPVIAIAEEYITSGVVFMTLAESNINSPQEFIRRKVGVIPGSDTGTIYDATISKLGIDKTSIREITIGFDMTPLFTGEIDVSTVAYVTNQPIFAREQGYDINVIDPKEFGINPGGNVFFTSESTLRSKRDVLKRFVRASLKGIMEAQKMTTGDVVDIVLKYNSELNRNAELEIWKATKKVLLNSNPDSLGIMPEKTWNRTAEIFKEFGPLETFPALNQAYTNDLVLEILEEGIDK